MSEIQLKIIQLRSIGSLARLPAYQVKYLHYCDILANVATACGYVSQKYLEIFTLGYIGSLAKLSPKQLIVSETSLSRHHGCQRQQVSHSHAPNFNIFLRYYVELHYDSFCACSCDVYLTKYLLVHVRDGAEMMHTQVIQVEAYHGNQIITTFLISLAVDDVMHIIHRNHVHAPSCLIFTLEWL